MTKKEIITYLKNIDVNAEELCEKQMQKAPPQAPVNTQAFKLGVYRESITQLITKLERDVQTKEVTE